MEHSLILAICMVVLFMGLIVYWAWIRKRLAIEKVEERTDSQKVKDINEALSLYGFLFDVQQDLVYSHMYPWQRKVGYCRLYDELAPSLNMIIDSEPIYFQYDGRRWLIEFWKGQYGMTTGGEVGVYVTDKEDVDIPGIFSGAFYECVSDDDRLQMAYTLKKEDKAIIERKGRHWWLTGFDVAVFSKPEQLSLELQIIFPNREMQRAFIKGLSNAGYKSQDIRVENRMVQVIFTTPRTAQPQKYGKWVVAWIQRLNRFYCHLFNWVTRDFTRTLDKIDFLRIYYPIFFRMLANGKRAKKLEELYKNMQPYLNQ